LWVKKIFPQRSRKNRLSRIKQIPEGPYCYTPIMWDTEKFSLHIKSCPFFKYKKDGSVKCSLLNLKSRAFDLNLLWDQVKCCSINDNYSEPTDQSGDYS
jgi:hypothetical protein